jgi:RNA polymerase sigma-70 factor (sigma-E family)
MAVSQPEFDEFAVRELPALLRYAVMLTGDPELAQDLVQDVMVKVLRHWRRVAAVEYRGRYVRTMVTREYLSWRRRWAVRHITPVPAEQLDRASSGDHAQLVADRDDVWHRLTRLRPRHRAVLVLRYYERLTDPEIASTLGCSAGTVRAYASRALAALRLELAAEPNDADFTLPRRPR